MNQRINAQMHAAARRPHRRAARLIPKFIINKNDLKAFRYLTVRCDECAAAYTIGRFAVSAVACILARSLYIKALSVYRRCDVLSAAHRVVERPYDLVHAYDHKNMRWTERKACYAVSNAVDIYDNAVLAHCVAACQEKVSGIVAAHDIHAFLHIISDYALDPGDADYLEQIREITGGEGVRGIVEVTGSAAALQQALVILDACRTPQQAAALLRVLNMAKVRHMSAIIGLTEEEGAEAFFSALETGLSPEEQKKDKSTMPGMSESPFDKVYLVTPAGVEEQLTRRLTEKAKYHFDAQLCTSLDEAVQLAHAHTRRKPPTAFSKK